MNERSTKWTNNPSTDEPRNEVGGQRRRESVRLFANASLLPAGGVMLLRIVSSYFHWIPFAGDTERKQWVLPLFSLRCHVVSYRIVVIVHRLCSCVRFYTNDSTSRAIIFRWNNSCGWLEILSHSVKTFKRFIRFTCFEWVQKFLRVFLVSISFVACVWSFWFIFWKGLSLSGSAFWLCVLASHLLSLIIRFFLNIPVHILCLFVFICSRLNAT